MIYANDRAIQMPVADLYDTQMMAMAINAAKDERDRAELRLDKFNELYGSFYSPSDVDMRRWKDIFSAYKDQIDAIYARGEDPTRTVEGRSALAAITRNLPYEDMNKLRLSAAIGQEYMKNAAKMQAEDLYDPEFQSYIMGGKTLRDWDTLNYGVFTYASPTALNPLKEDTDFLYKGRTAMPLTKEEVEAAGYTYDPTMEYTGFTRLHMIDIAKNNLPNFLSTLSGKYRAELVKKALEAQEQANYMATGKHNPVTDEQVNNALAELIADTNPSYLIAPTGTPNELETYNQKRMLNRIYSGSGGGTSYRGGTGSRGGRQNQPTEYYHTQDRYFIDGISKLLNVSKDVAARALFSDTNLLTSLQKTQGAILKNHETVDNNGKRILDVNGALKDLSVLQDIQEVADILRLKQVDDSDKKGLVYSLPKEELNNMITPNHLISRVFGTTTVSGAYGDESKKFRKKYDKYTRDEIKVAPTGHVVTYLSKDGSIKQYAKVNVFGPNHKDVMYIDMGNMSTLIKNKDMSGTRSPVWIDENLSTLRIAGYTDVDKKYASNTTKTRYTDNAHSEE